MLGVCNRLPSFCDQSFDFFCNLFYPMQRNTSPTFFFLQLNRFQTPVHTPLECQLVGPCGGPLFQLYVLFDFLFKKRQFFQPLYWEPFKNYLANFFP